MNLKDILKKLPKRKINIKKLKDSNVIADSEKSRDSDKVLELENFIDVAGVGGKIQTNQPTN